MRATLATLALGALLGLGACTDGDDTDETVDSGDDTSYEGMRVRQDPAGWRLPGNTPGADLERER
ncbi:MAG: hypothetical protein KC912_08980 [Proteobacteria bacterium]|nr:hypothetical protein [Pseudomonadota bacterium]